MANLLKVNVTVQDVAHVHQAAHQLKSLADHLCFENSQVEITVEPGSLPGAVVTAEQLKALETSITAMKASTDQLDEAVKKNAPDQPIK